MSSVKQNSMDSESMKGNMLECVPDVDLKTKAAYNTSTINRHIYYSKYLNSANTNGLDPACYLSSKLQQRSRDSVRPVNIRVGMPPAISTPPKDVTLNSKSESDSKTDYHSNTLKKSEVAAVETFKMPQSYVGFATLPNQLHRRSVRVGFCFNLMVVGESGLGKSTFINSLFMTDLCTKPTAKNEATTTTTQIVTKQLKLTENGVSLRLTLIDTPGFGDALDNRGCWEPIVNYIDSKFGEYVNAEFNIDRKLPIEDNRVHCCLYFIAPTGHSLRAIDIELMSRLSDRVNIVPLIAKSDSLTSQELKLFKKQIMTDLQKHKIKVYDFGLSDTTGPPEDFGSFNPQKMMPFAVIGSNCVQKDKQTGKVCRGRQYAWGFVDADNTEHSDFLPLRKMLIRTHMYDLRERTHCLHYESYRSSKLNQIINSTNNTDSNTKHRRNLLSQINEEKREFELRLNQTRKEMEQVYEKKVAEKMQKLEETRQNVQRTKENYERNIEDERQKLRSRRAQFEQEKSGYEHQSSTASTLTPKHKRVLF